MTSIETTHTDDAGNLVKIVYEDVDEERWIPAKPVTGVHGFCFYEDKLVVVFSEKRSAWSPPGGSVNPGESFQEALEREVVEETNMRIKSHALIGIQRITAPSGEFVQTRSVCIVEPQGAFRGDPDGDITEVRYINPADYRQYFDWGEVGDHLIRRALEKVKDLYYLQTP